MAGVVDTAAVAKLFREHFETPFTEAMDRDLFFFNFFGRKAMEGQSVQWKIHYPNSTAGVPTGDLVAVASKGTSYAENEDLLNTNKQAWIEAEVFVKQNYAGIEVSGLAQAATKSSKAAYMQAMSVQGKEGMEDLKNAIAAQLESTDATDNAGQTTGAGNSNKDIDGFRGIILKGAGSGHFYGGLALDTYTFLKPKVLANGGTARPLTLSLMQQIMTEMELPARSGAKISNVLGARVHYNQYGNILSDYRRFTGESMDGGYPSLAFEGTKVTPVPGISAGELWFIDKRPWGYYVLSNFETRDQATTTDADRYVVIHRSQLVCKHPGQQAAIDDLITT